MPLWVTTGDWIQLGSLLIAVVTLYFLIKYVRYTRVIAEATSKPAVIATRSGVVTNPPRLRNIGSGPALDVQWSVSGTKKAGKITYIEHGKESDALDVNLHSLQSGAVISGANKVTITCSYSGISGKRFSSESAYSFDSGEFFGTEFKE